MKQPQRGRKGQKGGRIDFSKVPPTAKLGRVPSSFGGGARGARGSFFKNFSAHEVTDSPNLIHTNSISHNLRPHGTCITLVGMPTGGRHNCRAVIRAKACPVPRYGSLPRTPIRSLPRTPIRSLPRTPIRSLPRTPIRSLPRTPIRSLPRTPTRGPESRGDWRRCQRRVANTD